MQRILGMRYGIPLRSPYSGHLPTGTQIMNKGITRLDHYRNRIFVGMKIAGKPAVNWNKLRKAQQDPEENPSALHRDKENTLKNVLPAVRSGKKGE